MIAAKRARQGMLVLLAAALAIAPAAYTRAADPTAPAEKAGAESAKTNESGHEKGADVEEQLLPKGPQEVVDWHTDLAVWSFVVFLLLLLILTKFAWKPIVAGLAKREQGIEDHIAAAKRANEDAKKLLADYDQKLAGAADQVRVMLDQARRDAEQTKLDIIAEAKAAAQLEQQRVVREVRIATDSALKELSEKSTQLAIELAGKIVKRQLTPEDHARLAQEALALFAARSASVN